MTWNDRSISEWTSLCLKVCSLEHLYISERSSECHCNYPKLVDLWWFTTLLLFLELYKVWRQRMTNTYRVLLWYQVSLENKKKQIQGIMKFRRPHSSFQMTVPNECPSIILCIARHQKSPTTHQTNKLSKITVQILFIKRLNKKSLQLRVDKIRSELTNSCETVEIISPLDVHLKPTSTLHTQVTYE